MYATSLIPLGYKLFKEEDVSLRSTVYRTDTHTDQYMNYASHHPIYKRLGIGITLITICETIATDDGNKKEEMEHLRGDL